MCAQQIEYGQTVTGTSDSRLLFTGAENDVVSIDVRITNSVDNAAKIELRRPNEDLLRDEEGNAENGNAALSLVELPQVAGDYIIDVTNASYSDSSTIEYELSLYKGVPPERSLSYGGTASGELSRSSRYYDDPGISGYHDTYGLVASEGDEITVEMRPDNPVDNQAKLVLYDPDGTEVQQRRENGEDGNAVITQYSVDEFQGGEYAVIAAAPGETDLFSYTVSAYEGLPIDRTISYGESRTGEITASDRYYDDPDIDGYHETYGLQASEGDEITIEMRPDNPVDNQAQLVLYDPDGTEVEQGIENGEDGNAVITQYAVDEFQGGEYTVVATGTGTEDLFTYTIRAYEGLPIDRSLSYGETLSGAITSDDRYYDDADIEGYHETYGLVASEGDEITIELRPDNPVDNRARLVLYDPDGTEVEQETANGEDGNAVITQYAVDEFQGGEYTVVATGPLRDDRFSYTIAAYEGIPIDRTISYGESLTEEITADDRYYDDVEIDGYHRTYGFTALEDNSFSIEMQPDSSVEYVAQLVLYDPDGEEVTRRSGNADNGAVIQGYSPNKAGTYTVVATGTSGTAQFSYTLSLSLDSGTRPQNVHPSGVSIGLWEAVTAQNSPTTELTSGDLDGAVQAYETNSTIDGVAVTFQDLIDLVQWFNQQ